MFEVTACLGESGFESFRVHIDRLMLDADLVGPDADRSGSWTERLVSIQQGEIRLATAFEDCAGGELGWATTYFDLARPHRAGALDKIAKLGEAGEAWCLARRAPSGVVLAVWCSWNHIRTGR